MRIGAHAAAAVGSTFALTASLACATPTLIAVGQLNGSAAGSHADLSGLGGTLEDFSLATSGTNQFFVFAATDTDLGATFDPQAIAAAVPEAQTYALLGAGIGVLAWVVRRRRR
jgi:hypothetical protein